MSEVVAGLAGAVVGAFITVAGTLWMSTFLERRRETRALLGALKTVRVELEGDGRRIRRAETGQETAAQAAANLTYGDWKANKVTLQGLILRPTNLWDALSSVYDSIYEAARQGGDLPTVADLDAILKEIDEETARLEGEMSGWWLFRHKPGRRARAAGGR